MWMYESYCQSFDSGLVRMRKWNLFLFSLVEDMIVLFFLKKTISEYLQKRELIGVSNY